MSSDHKSMIRVDHAGEYGATRIYAGQLAILGSDHAMSGEIAHMAVQEERHRRLFDGMITERGVRPTLLQPFWDVAGFALGAATALIGPKAAMACTAAIETEIDAHYAEQLRELDAAPPSEADPELRSMIAEFQAEEVQHRDIALAAGAEQAPGYPLLAGAIRLGCRAAIALSKRI